MFTQKQQQLFESDPTRLDDAVPGDTGCRQRLSGK